METEKVKALTESVKEIGRDHVALAKSLGSLSNGAEAAKRLWRKGNKSILIKAGLSLILFPEPIVSDVLGTALLAAGAVHEGIKRQSIYLDDLPKALKSAINDLKIAKELI